MRASPIEISFTRRIVGNSPGSGSLNTAPRARSRKVGNRFSEKIVLKQKGAARDAY
jgi:hypothetical protein